MREVNLSIFDRSLKKVIILEVNAGSLQETEAAFNYTFS